MNILFVSRAYPPVTGGIENQNYDLSKWLPEFSPTTTIANRYGRKALPFFAPWALLRALFLMRKYDVLLLGDGVLFILGYFIKLAYPNKTVIAIVHGLDLSWNSKSLGVWYEHLLISIYRKLWLDVFVKKIDGFITVSSYTKEVAVENGLPLEHIRVIKNGIETEKFEEPRDRNALAELLKRDITDRVILLTAGRLAKRKGVAWFIRHVLPRLDASLLYVVAGSGPDQANIETAIVESGMGDRVIMLGRVGDSELKLLFNSSDIFIQPNIPVPGDTEGFGLTPLEAAATGLPVVVSDLEGLKDAFMQGENGILVRPEDSDGFIRALNELAENTDERRRFGDHAARYVENHFHWKVIANQYVETLQTFVDNSQKKA